MSLNSIMDIASSGLYASQRAIKTVTNNVANVNTPGYVRLDHNQQARDVGGTGGGVDVGSVRRAADRFLQAASLAASSSAGGAGEKFKYLDAVQAGFGNPTSSNSLFAKLNRALGSFESAALNPNAAATRATALSELQSVLGSIGTLGEQVSAARADVDARIGDQVKRVNTLLVDIARTNVDIQRGALNDDSSAAMQRQSTLIDELSTYIDIRVSSRSDGTTEVRTTDGVMLAGQDHASLAFSPSPQGATQFDRIKIQYGSDPQLRDFEGNLQSGSLRGLLSVRDTDLRDVAMGLGELAGGLADALNAAHNQNASLPPIAKTNGVDTGLQATDALGFTGKTSIGIVDASGILKRKIDIDFDAGTLSVDGGASVSFGAAPAGTIGSFQSVLNTALGTMGSATFANGKLQLTAAPPSPATNPATGFVFDEPDSGGSLRGNKAFAHFFGLNDLVRSGTPSAFATGLRASDAHGFPVGAKLGIAVRGSDGSFVANREITVPAGTMGDMLTALNDPVTGLGNYGAFSLDSAGQMKWTPLSGQAETRLDVTNDVGPRGTTTRSFAQMFGLSDTARQSRATGLSIDAAIVADPRKLGLARPDLSTVALGQAAIGAADGRGAQALFDVSRSKISFSGPTGGVGRTTTLADFTSSLGGDIASRASRAESDKSAATAFSTEANARRSNVEGVNLDEELVKLTSYQQAYSAAARMIRAADEMYQALLNAI
jgi:flagellar hook-associated protein 1 FlgK